MKTFTVTFHHTTNYGALLQTYALQQALLSKGHENLVMEYVGMSAAGKQPRSIVRRMIDMYHRLQLQLRRAEFRRLLKSFRSFHDDHLLLSRKYESMDDLRSDPPQVDCLITGSDQVWNMHTSKHYIPARFLDFGDASLRRFSYAASIEKLDYTQEEKEYARKALAGFSGISLREESARKYMEEIVGRPCVQTADPVFLLKPEEWLKIARPARVEGKYILCYQVQHNDLMQSTLDQLKKQTGWKTVAVCNTPTRYCKADVYLHDVSPEEFLSLYAGASAVVSASFHGTAFGLVFGKPVYSLTRPGFGGRMKDLMRAFEMEEYVISAKGKIPALKTDLSKQGEILAHIRQDAHCYLERMLEKDE